MISIDTENIQNALPLSKVAKQRGLWRKQTAICRGKPSDPRFGFNRMNRLPLQITALNGSSRTAIALMDHGASPLQLDPSGRSLVHYAAAGTEAFFKALVKRGGVKYDTQDTKFGIKGSVSLPCIFFF